MTTETPQGAIIYQFPIARVRKSVAKRDEQADAPKSVIGSAWYHDAAIQEAKRAGER